MLKRTITGFFFILILIGSILAGPYVFTLLFLVIAIYSLFEFYSITNNTAKPNRILGVLIGCTLFVGASTNALGLSNISLFIFSFFCIVFLFIQELFRESDRPFGDIGVTIIGILYTVVPFLCFYQLGFLHSSYNTKIPLAFLIMLWSNDTGAYLAGKYFGKRKLFERHSPKKTWEGAFGGLLLALMSACVIAYNNPEVPLNIWFICAGIIVVFGTCGDLVESMLKRSYQIKDSGNLLPGHGGLLDRFDGLLLAAPVVYVFLRYLAQIP